MVQGYIKKVSNFLINFFETLDNIKKDVRYKLAIMSSLFFGGISYIYLISNNVHNYDNIYNTPSGVGGGLTLGRWLIQILWKKQINWAGGIQFYNSSTVNTIIALFFLVLCCLLLVSILEIKSTLGCIVLPAITISFPAVAATMVFNFTVQIYGYSLFLAVLGVYFGKKRNVFGFILSIVMNAQSIGGYQAYFAYIAVLFLMILIQYIMRSDTDWKECFSYAIRFLLILLGTYVVYMLILKFYLKKWNMTLSSRVSIAWGKLTLRNCQIY